MTTLHKLSIQGVRSYASDKPQHIDFLSPLTIILGNNGAGKTTIIEALKFACTGAQPPLSDAGKRFVHDPKLSGSSTVKAQIKLSFAQPSGRVVHVEKRFQVSTTKTGQSFKQIDATLRAHDPATDERVTTTNRCSDVEKEVPMLLGVSGAILEHVILAHQDDALWPLGEDRVLKDRFDEIFAAARYTMVLTALRDARKQETIRLKDAELEVERASDQRAYVERRRAELAELDASILKHDGEKELVRARLEEVRRERQAREERQGMIEKVAQRWHGELREVGLRVAAAKAARVKLGARMSVLLEEEDEEEDAGEEGWVSSSRKKQRGRDGKAVRTSSVNNGEFVWELDALGEGGEGEEAEAALDAVLARMERYISACSREGARLARVQEESQQREQTLVQQVRSAEREAQAASTEMERLRGLREKAEEAVKAHMSGEGERTAALREGEDAVRRSAAARKVAPPHASWADATDVTREAQVSAEEKAGAQLQKEALVVEKEAAAVLATQEASVRDARAMCAAVELAVGRAEAALVVAQGDEQRAHAERSNMQSMLEDSPQSTAARMQLQQWLTQHAHACAGEPARAADWAVAVAQLPAAPASPVRRAEENALRAVPTACAGSGAEEAALAAAQATLVGDSGEHDAALAQQASAAAAEHRESAKGLRARASVLASARSAAVLVHDKRARAQAAAAEAEEKVSAAITHTHQVAATLLERVRTGLQDLPAQWASHRLSRKGAGPAAGLLAPGLALGAQAGADVVSLRSVWGEWAPQAWRVDMLRREEAVRALVEKHDAAVRVPTASPAAVGTVPAADDAGWALALQQQCDDARACLRDRLAWTDAVRHSAESVAAQVREEVTHARTRESALRAELHGLRTRRNDLQASLEVAGVWEEVVAGFGAAAVDEEEAPADSAHGTWRVRTVPVVLMPDEVAAARDAAAVGPVLERLRVVAAYAREQAVEAGGDADHRSAKASVWRRLHADILAAPPGAHAAGDHACLCGRLLDGASEECVRARIDAELARLERSDAEEARRRKHECEERAAAADRAVKAAAAWPAFVRESLALAARLEGERAQVRALASVCTAAEAVAVHAREAAQSAGVAAEAEMDVSLAAVRTCVREHEELKDAQALLTNLMNMAGAAADSEDAVSLEERAAEHEAKAATAEAGCAVLRTESHRKREQAGRWSMALRAAQDAVEQSKLLQQRLAEVEDQCARAKAAVRAATVTVEEARARVPTATAALQQAEQALADMTRDSALKVARAREQAQNVREWAARARKALSRVREVESARSAFEEARARSSELAQQLEQLNETRAALVVRVNTTHANLNAARAVTAEAQDNAEYLSLVSQAAASASKCAQLKRAARKVLSEQGSLADSLAQLHQDEITLTAAANRLSGHVQADEKRADLIDEELKKPENLGVFTRFATANARLFTRRYIATDLERYFRCLDRALMRFHEVKLKTINATLKDLWRQVYVGRDVSHIYIRSDPSDEPGDSSLRRKYRYRVLMVRDDVEHDMRGRCSAGQRVLACLLIRLALAESFCVKCGVMALDEPTSNLDSSNSGAFADALVRLIERRRGQRGFQLVLITHDPELVERLGRSTGTDRYYNVYKDDTQHSMITSMPFHH